MAPTTLAQSPLNRRIKDYILTRIADGDWKTGDRIPSENKLAEEFSASRMTVNRAIRELAVEGRLARVQGLGTFVAETAPLAPLFEVRSIASEIGTRGGVHDCEVIEVAARAATAEVASRLDLPEGSRVYSLVALHRCDGRPLQLERRLVNPDLAGDFLHQDFTKITGSDYLLRNVPFTEVEHQVDAIRPAPEVARLLELAPDEPCLRLVRITWSGERRITHAELIHPGKQFRLGGRFGAAPRIGGVA